jgi:hypothetical protein
MTDLRRESVAKLTVRELANELLQVLIEIQQALENHAFAIDAGSELASSHCVERLRKILHSPSYFDLVGQIMGASGDDAALNFQQRLNATINTTLHKCLQGNASAPPKSALGVPLSEQMGFREPHRVIRLMQGQISSVFGLRGQLEPADQSPATDNLTENDQNENQSEVDLNSAALKAVVDSGFEEVFSVADGASSAQKCNAIMNRWIDNRNDDEIMKWPQYKWVEKLRDGGHRFSKKTVADTAKLEDEPENRRAWARIMQFRRGARNDYLVSDETAEEIFPPKNT